MYCQKCGKEIMDEAVVCPNCGCATSKFSTSTTTQTTVKKHSSEYNKVLDFYGKVKASYVLAILSLVLSMGIGIFIAIINSFLIKGLNNYSDISVTEPDAVLFYEKVMRKLAITKKIHMIATIIGGTLLFVLIMMLLAGGTM